MEREIRAFLADVFFLGDDPADLPADDSLIDSGIIDSNGVLELVDFLEQEYGILIQDEEMIPENLGSVNNIVSFVTRKKAVKAV
jgi:acyl carrier protein